MRLVAPLADEIKSQSLKPRQQLVHFGTGKPEAVLVAVRFVFPCGLVHPNAATVFCNPL